MMYNEIVACDKCGATPCTIVELEEPQKAISMSEFVRRYQFPETVISKMYQYQKQVRRFLLTCPDESCGHQCEWMERLDDPQSYFSKSPKELQANE